MPTLFPPDYPDRPDAPLLAFGPSFSEEISRSVIQAVWHESTEQPHEADVRVAAALTMLEGFHPRDHVECMMAAQGVAAHAAIMECFARAMFVDTPEATAIKLRGNAATISRTFSVTLRDLERRQSKPLIERPPPVPPPEAPPPGDAPSGNDDPDSSPEDELPTDMVTRPDGTPGSLAAYAPKPPKDVYIPREAPIMLALATRPKPWRMVNAPPTSPAATVATTQQQAAEPPRTVTRSPIDLKEKIFTGDGLARFASARFDPDAPIEPPDFEHEDATFELELISTGGDPEAEAERQALIAAHPEGKPIKTFRYGTKKPPDEPPNDNATRGAPDDEQ